MVARVAESLTDRLDAVVAGTRGLAMARQTTGGQKAGTTSSTGIEGTILVSVVTLMNDTLPTNHIGHSRTLGMIAVEARTATLDPPTYHAGVQACTSQVLQHRRVALK